MFLENLRGEDVCPKGLVLAERYLQLDRIGMEALTSEHGGCVVEDMTASLYTLIEPTCAVLFFVEWYGKRLTSAIVDRVDNCHIELICVLGEVVRRGHAVAVNRGSSVLETCAYPAAPAPTTSTLVRSSLVLLAPALILAARCSSAPSAFEPFVDGP